MKEKLTRTRRLTHGTVQLYLNEIDELYRRNKDTKVLERLLYLVQVVRRQI